MADEVLCNVQEGIATLTLNRPEKRNALNNATMELLSTYLQQFEQQADVRVIVFRGAGKVFCAGRDLREMHQQQHSGDRPTVDVVTLFHQIEASRHPTIAMVQGDALAGGCELAIHCDMRVAAEGVRFGMPLARLGLVVPFLLTNKLVEVIGPAWTRHFLLTAQPVTAQKAFAMGMVHQVVSAEELEQTTYALARSIAGNAPLALQGIKACIARTLEGREQLAHADLDAMVERTRLSEDAREGVRAWLEKRPPQFHGQ